MARVSEEFREIIAEEIPKLKDPRMGFVTVTGVKVTPDLRKARVFYSVLGEDKEKAGTRAALRSSRSHLRSAIGRQVRLKFLPDLVFEEDTLFDETSRIEQLLRQAQVAHEEIEEVE